MALWDYLPPLSRPTIFLPRVLLAPKKSRKAETTSLMRTSYLQNAEALDLAQRIASHADSWTTKAL